ncbi:hypothetical protein SAMN02745165_01491 [Malonomonas rubra DSM 5091]|uniref:Repeat domain-containing protein n=1 Tax=Malonomonas rubra DSM 5091 TaxID=1122189 RepID=A0A1M6GC76_MALRU|nr:VCBS repeat-containing protein [Malonomonas rubra]SHJ07524.1 hypothetical protein SAMN02745165_01491 [Malonomonas rubra DSM 5091]
MLKKTLLALILLFAMTLPAFASNYAMLAEDLKTIEGTIIIPIGEEFLIDLDSSSNLRLGDIVTLISPGEAIIHPVSKEVLGTLDIPRGFLSVTRIKSGYSYAKPLSTETKPQRGDKVVRFEQAPARIIAATAGDTETIRDIKGALPQLHWLADNATESALMTFQLEGNQLSILGSENNLLYQYAIYDQGLSAIQSAPVEADEASPKNVFSIDDSETSTGFLDAALKGLISTVSTGKPLDGPPQNSTTKALHSDWNSPAILGKAIGIAVADFNGDGQSEIAVALHNQLVISKLTAGNYQQLASLDTPRGAKLLSLDAIDLDRNGLPELYVTAAVGGIMSSYSVRYENGSYNQHTPKTRWYLRSVELPGEGPVLLGQNRGLRGEAFQGKAFRVALAGNELVAGETLELPGGNLYGFIPLAGIDKEPGFAYLNGSDRLVVSDSQGTVLWQSEEVYGGSLTILESDLTGDGPADVLNFMPSKLSASADGLLLVPQNYGPRILSYWRSFDNSRLAIFKWNGTEMQESWSSGTIAGYLADFTVADVDNDQINEAVLLIQTESGLIKKQAATAIRSFKLSQ